MSEMSFEVAGAELDWPIGSAAGMTNHPSVEGVAARFDTFTKAGLGFVVLGSWKLGEASGGNGYVQTETGWQHRHVDEYVDLDGEAGYNAKGLPGPGTDAGMQALPDFIDLARSRDVETVLSLSPHTAEPLKELRELLEIGRKALKLGVLYVEVNLSCPNIPSRPPFYRDIESVVEFYQMVEAGAPLINRYGHPGLYPKFGPRTEADYFEGWRIPGIGGLVTSNTLGNQEPADEAGRPAVGVNGGKAGMSGPALAWLGREQLAQARAHEQPDQQIISVLGVSTGAEVKRRLELGASAVQLGSVLYWPELIGCETPVEAVRQIKQEFVTAVAT